MTRWAQQPAILRPIFRPKLGKNCVQTKATSLGPESERHHSSSVGRFNTEFFGGCQKKKSWPKISRIVRIRKSLIARIWRSNVFMERTVLPTCGGWCLVWWSNKKEGNIKSYRTDVRCVFERSHFEVSNEQKKVVVVWVMLGTSLQSFRGSMISHNKDPYIN